MKKSICDFFGTIKNIPRFLSDKINLKKHSQNKVEIPDMPDWEEIVEMMYDKCLDVFDSEVVRVIYSQNRTMRYVVLKNEKGYFTFRLEAIYQRDGDEWKYIFSEDNSLPAFWEPAYCGSNKSIFATEEEAINELKNEGTYKKHFM